MNDITSLRRAEVSPLHGALRTKGLLCLHKKGYFYCGEARNTMFEGCKPKDDGHHSALYSIPRRMEEARREQRMKEEIQQCEMELADLQDESQQSKVAEVWARPSPFDSFA